MAIRVLVRQGLLGQQVEAFSLPSSAVRSARDLLDRFADAMPRHAEIEVAVNGGLLSPQQLDDPVADGDQVVLMPRTSDVVSIVVTILINVAVSAAVNYVASLLSPRPKAPGVPQDRGYDASSTFAWDGIKTNYGPGLPIPWAYGRHALGGQVIWNDVQVSRSSAQASVDDRLRLILSLCEGPIHRFGDIAAGSIDGLGGFFGGVAGPPIPSELRVNGTLIPSTETLPGVLVSLRPGTQDQPAFQAPFSGVRQTFTIGESVGRGDSRIFTFEPDNEIAELAFVVTFPSGLYQQAHTGAITGLAVGFNAFWRPQGAGSWTPLGFLSVPAPPGGYIGLHAVTFRRALGPGVQGPIEIMLQNQYTAPAPNVSYVDAAVWRDLVVISPHVLRYPREALLGIEIQAGARFSGGLPQISLRCDCMLVRVWDATHGWSPRCWDVPPAPHDFNTYPPGRNPAWVLLDFLLGRHGLGRWITEDRVDLPAFRRWAAFCDQDPNPGDPWGEAAFCVDVVGDVVRPAWEWVLLFCSAGRATPVMRNGKISVVYQYRDAHSDGGITVPAKEPLQLLTSGNCEDVSVQLMPKRNRATVFEFQFLNEEAAYTQDVLPVEDDEATFQNPTALQRDQVRVEAIQAWGITRASQLFREGRWRHRVGRLVDWELSGRTGPWALAAEVGDLFDFEHDLLRPFGTDVSLTMQVLAVDLAFGTVTVDHHMAGTGLQIVVRDRDGKPLRRNVTSYANATVAGRKQSVLTLASPADVAVGATCVVGRVDKLTQTYELVSISQAKSLHREFRAVQWTPEAYDPITREDFLGTIEAGDLPPEAADDVFASPDLDALPPNVLGIRVVAQADGSHLVRFARPASKAGTWARVYVRPSDIEGAWVLVAGTELDEAPVRGLTVGTSYVVSVCLENRRGDPVPPDLGDHLTFVPEEFAATSLPKITNAKAVLLGDSLQLSWNGMGQRTVDGYEVRCGTNWAAAAVVARVAAPRLVLPNPPAGPPFLIAARATSGLYGGIASVTNPNWSPRGAVQVLDENDLSPSPAGTHTDTQWNGTSLVLELAAGALRGTYESAEQDLGTQAPYFWQVLIDREEFEDLTVGDLAGLQLGSGEARWRLLSGRPASPASPGLGWHLRCQDLAGTLVADLPRDLLARGWRGVVGSHTRVLLESRFLVGGAWTAYEEHTDRFVVASKAQFRLTLGRRSLQYRARVRQLVYRAFV